MCGGDNELRGKCIEREREREREPAAAYLTLAYLTVS